MENNNPNAFEDRSHYLSLKSHESLKRTKSCLLDHLKLRKFPKLIHFFIYIPMQGTKTSTRPRTIGTIRETCEANGIDAMSRQTAVIALEIFPNGNWVRILSRYRCRNPKKEFSDDI